MQQGAAGCAAGWWLLRVLLQAGGAVGCFRTFLFEFLVLLSRNSDQIHNRSPQLVTVVLVYSIESLPQPRQLPPQGHRLFSTTLQHSGQEEAGGGTISWPV